MPRFGKDTVRENVPNRVVEFVDQHDTDHQLQQAAESLNSRRFIAAIFGWYKILSPNIEINIESVGWDAGRHRLYVGMRQRFALWFVPLYAAHVRLLVELHLEAVVDGNGHDGNSYAAVAAQQSTTHVPNTARNRMVNGVPGTAHQPPRTRYYIARHEDHYQINEVLKFFSLSVGAWLWALAQLFATFVCVIGAGVWDTTIGVAQGTKRAVIGGSTKKKQ